MAHSVNECPLTKLDVAIGALHTADDNTVAQLDSQRKQQKKNQENDTSLLSTRINVVSQLHHKVSTPRNFKPSQSCTINVMLIL